MNIVVNIGHGGKGKNYDSGAIGADGTHEHMFNRDELAPLIVKELTKRKHTVTVITQESCFSELPARINAVNPDVIIALHYNAYDGKATGTETLYYLTSRRSKKLAECIQSKVVWVLQLANRGVKGLLVGRGSALLRKTKAPCVILEPFFGDNANDLSTARKKISALAIAICDGLDTWNFNKL